MKLFKMDSFFKDYYFQVVLRSVSAFLKSLEEQGDPCSPILRNFVDDFSSKGAFTAPTKESLVKIITDLAPKLKDFRNGDQNLPCLATMNSLFDKYKEKLTSFFSMASTLGILPDLNKAKQEL